MAQTRVLQGKKHNPVSLISPSQSARKRQDGKLISAALKKICVPRQKRDRGSAVPRASALTTTQFALSTPEETRTQRYMA